MPGVDHLIKNVRADDAAEQNLRAVDRIESEFQLISGAFVGADIRLVGTWCGRPIFSYERELALAVSTTLLGYGQSDRKELNVLAAVPQPQSRSRLSRAASRERALPYQVQLTTLTASIEGGHSGYPNHSEAPNVLAREVVRGRARGWDFGIERVVAHLAFDAEGRRADTFRFANELSSHGMLDIVSSGHTRGLTL